MRRGFGLLAIAWLNLALTPCALAIGGEHDCPHSPPAGHHEMAGHSEHMAEHMAEHPCASMQDACCEIPDASVDMRAGTVKFDDAITSIGADARLVLGEEIRHSILSLTVTGD